MITCRSVTLGILIRVLTLSTETQHLAYGITRLGLSYKAAHIITSAFNLIPSFGEEVGLIIDARRLRGVKVRKNMNIFNMLSEYSTLALPLIMKAMRRAVSIGLIMDARAFGAYKYRTWLLETRMTAIDFSAITVGAAYTAVMVFLNHIF
jgi:energy-coupling factor transport system permease protein